MLTHVIYYLPNELTIAVVATIVLKLSTTDSHQKKIDNFPIPYYEGQFLNEAKIWQFWKVILRRDRTVSNKRFN